MKPMREKIQTKLNSMASILLDDIIVPDRYEQHGSGTIAASLYDDKGNKFRFTLSLDVSQEDDEPNDELTIPEQIGIINEQISLIKNDIANLKSFHTTPTEGVDDEL